MNNQYKKTKAVRKKFPKHGQTIIKSKLPGRNDPCPCGSGKKFKHCCIDKWEGF